MNESRIEAALQKLDERFDRIEQILPTLVTKDESARFATKDDLAGFATRDDLAGFAMRDDLAGFATRDDLAGFGTRDDLAGFATKDDLAAFATKDDLAAFAMRDDLAGFATTVDLQGLRVEVRAEAEATRRHFDAVAEAFMSQVNLASEGHQLVSERSEREWDGVRADVRAIDRRVMRLEADKLRR